MSRKRSRGYGFEVQGVKAGDPAPGTSTAPWELDVEQLPNKRRQADSKAMEHAWLGFRNGGRQQRQWAKHQQPVQQPLPVVQLPKNAVQPAPVVPTVQGFQSSFSVQSYAFPATATSSTQQQSTAPAKPKKNRELEPRGVEIVVNDTVIGSYVREPRKQKQESPQAKKQKVQKPQPEQQNSGERCQSANAWREIIPDMFQAGPSSNSSVIVLRDVVVSNRRSRVEALRGLFARLGDGLSVSREQIRGGGQAVVSSAIWDDYRSNAETRQSFNEKLDFWIAVDGALEREFGSNCRSHVFGSTLSGFGSKESDVDLCVFAYDGMAQAAARLQKVRKLLRRYFRDAVSPNIELIPAKVPLLKFYYYNLEVDVSCNNEMGTRNTHLLYCYGQCDWRVRPMVCAIKSWARQNNINDARNGSLSSYALTLLMINYLQIVQPPVVPVLQDRHPELFAFPTPDDDNVFTLPFLQPLPPHNSENKMSLGTLFAGFMSHYNGRFDFSADVASVRTGRVLINAECHAFAKQNQNGPGQWNAYVCVEEPVDRSNAARAVCRREAFDEVLYHLAETDAKGKAGDKSLFR